MKKGVLLLILILLSSCAVESNIKEFEPTSYKPTALPGDDSIRPAIDRVEPPVFKEEETDKESEVQRVPELSTPVDEYKLSIGYGLFPISHYITGSFTKYDFPELLKSRTIQSQYEPISARYEQFLRLIGGRVALTGDEYDNVDNFLVYEDKEPVMEYELLLSAGTFLDYIGSNIWFLGNVHIITDATEKEVILVSERGDRLVIGGGSILLNDEVLEDTNSRMTGNAIIITSYAEAPIEGDNLYIEKGSSLQEEIGEPVLLTNKFNIRYLGMIDVPSSAMHFDNKGENIQLRLSGLGRNMIIPLVREDGVLGDDEGMLHVLEGTSTSDYKVNLEDYFILSAPASPTQIYNWYSNSEVGMLGTVMQYKEINHKERSIEFGSRDGVGIKGFYTGTPGDDARGEIYFNGRAFRFFVGPGNDSNPISIDMNGDGRVSGAALDLPLGDAIIDFPSGESFNNSFNLTLRLLNFGVTSFTEERRTVQINPDLTIQLYSDSERFSLDKGNEAEVSSFGTQYLLFDQESGESFRELFIDHPLAERFAEIMIEAK